MGEEITISVFDRTIGSLSGLPDVVHTKPSTIRATMPLIGLHQSYIVQTFRQRDGQGDDARSKDTIFLETVADPVNGGSIRLVIPPEVADAIARQRDALSGMNRRKAAKRVAAERKAAGIEPGFMKGKRGKR